MDAGTPPAAGNGDFWSQGLDRAFFRRVYGRSVQMGTLAVLLCMVLEQRATGIGLTSGLVVGLFSLWTVEATVKLLFNGGSAAGLKLAIGGLLKMPFLLAGLLGVAWASFNGHMNIFGVLGGVLLVHGTMLLTVVATAISAQESNTERYR